MAEALPLLIVEKNRDMVVMLQRFFARQHITVEAVTNITDAGSYLAQRPVGVVLTDLFSPHNDGLTLVRYVRQVAPHTRVVVMGTFHVPEVEQDAIEAGAHAFIEKPFALERLGGIVGELLRPTPGVW